MVGAKLLRADGRKALPCVFPLPARFFCCQPRCFVRQHPRSAALVLAFLRPPPFFCCATAFLRPSAPPVCRFSPRISAVCAFLLQPTAFLLLCSRVVGSPLLPFRVYFSSLAAAKGFVLLKICVCRLAPLVVIVRGAQLFLAFLSLVSGSLRPFFVDKRCVFVVGCRVSVPVCGLFRSQGLRFSRFNASFRHLVWGFGGLRAALSRFSAPLLGQRSPLRLRSLRSGGKCAPIFHLSTICFPQSFPRCGENVHLPVCFAPPFRFSTVGRTDPLPPRGGKVPLHARVYII